MEQTGRHLLAPHDIGFQLMQDRLFCLSVEEALRYRKELWRFGSQQNNPAVQISPYSQGYYLRTPYYAEDHEGRFYYSDHVYAVDLVNGNIHPVPAGEPDIRTPSRLCGAAGRIGSTVFLFAEP